MCVSGRVRKKMVQEKQEVLREKLGMVVRCDWERCHWPIHRRRRVEGREERVPPSHRGEVRRGEGRAAAATNAKSVDPL